MVALAMQGACARCQSLTKQVDTLPSWNLWFLEVRPTQRWERGALGETLEESPFVGPDTPGTTMHRFFLLVGRLTHLCS